MTSGEISRLKKRIRTVYLKLTNGSPHNLEDIIQDVLLRFLSGKSDKATCFQVIVDSLREYSGRKDKCKDYQTRINLEMAIQYGCDDDFLLERGTDHVSQIENKLDFIRYLKFINNKKQRTAFYLYYYEGYRFNEIGKILDCSHEYASQLVEKANDHLRATLNDSN